MFVTPPGKTHQMASQRATTAAVIDDHFEDIAQKKQNLTQLKRSSASSFGTKRWTTKADTILRKS